MITQLSPTPTLSANVFPAPDDASSRAMFVVSTLGNSYRDFGHACEAYNSTFFKDESPEFRQALCFALSNHFSQWTNLYWAKQSLLTPALDTESTETI